jgi:hypothetical protein
MRIPKQAGFRGWWLVLLSLVVVGCSTLPTYKDDFTKINDDFMNRMRWHDITGASQSFAPKQQEAFLDRFEAWDDLKITSFTAVRSSGDAEIGLEVKKVHYLLEYHALPSLSIKQKRFVLRWEKEGEKGAWQIVEPFPEL